jgi:hypothetical protein
MSLAFLWASYGFAVGCALDVPEAFALAAPGHQRPRLCCILLKPHFQQVSALGPGAEVATRGRLGQGPSE